MIPAERIDKLADEIIEIVRATRTARWETGDRTPFDWDGLGIQIRRTIRDSCSELWEESAAEVDAEKLRDAFAWIDKHAEDVSINVEGPGDEISRHVSWWNGDEYVFVHGKTILECALKAIETGDQSCSELTS